MAHFAELDKDNKVLRVVVVANLGCMKDSVKEESLDLISTIRDISGNTCNTLSGIVEWEDEEKGIAFCKTLLGGVWIQTSYHGNIRRRYAGIGYTYDEGRDAFITPQPFPSWTLDKVGDWQPPIAKPDGGDYSWDEKDGEWVELNEDSLGIA